MPLIGVNSVQLDVHQWPPTEAVMAGAVPLLLLRGFTDPIDDWQELITAAGNRGPVLTLDLRGEGYSTVGEAAETATLVDLVDDLIGVLDTLDVPRVHMFGYAPGGVVALATAIMHPHRVAGLVLMCTTPEAAAAAQAGPVAMIPLTFEADATEEGGAAGDKAPRYVMQGAVVERTDAATVIAGSGLIPSDVRIDDDGVQPLPDNGRVKDVISGGHERTGRTMSAAAVAIQTRPDLTPALMNLGVPVLVLVGEDAPPALQRGAELLHGWIPTSRLVRLPGAALAPHREQPAACVSTALGFIREVDHVQDGSEAV